MRARRLLVRTERRAARDAATRALRRTGAADANRRPHKASRNSSCVGAKPVPEWWKLYRSDALNALVDEGLRNSPTLAAADKSLAAAREQLRAQIGSSMLPTIDAGGQATRNRALAIPEIGPNTFLYNVFVGQLQAHYTFDLFGAARLRRRGARRARQRSGVSVRRRAPRAGRQYRDARRSPAPRCMRRSRRPNGSWRSPTIRPATRSGAMNWARSRMPIS